jgi:hypothetical protein
MQVVERKWPSDTQTYQGTASGYLSASVLATSLLRWTCLHWARLDDMKVFFDCCCSYCWHVQQRARQWIVLTYLAYSLPVCSNRQAARVTLRADKLSGIVYTSTDGHLVAITFSTQRAQKTTSVSCQPIHRSISRLSATTTLQQLLSDFIPQFHSRCTDS